MLLLKMAARNNPPPSGGQPSDKAVKRLLSRGLAPTVTLLPSPPPVNGRGRWQWMRRARPLLPAIIWMHFPRRSLHPGDVRMVRAKSRFITSEEVV